MIIFISGPLGAGKSTTAKHLKKLIQKSVIVEPDDIRMSLIRANKRMVPIDKTVPITLKRLIPVLKNHARERTNVIVPYPLSYKNYLFLKRNLRNVKIHFFTLNPSLQSIVNGRGKRKLDAWEKTRVKHHYKIKLHKPSFGIRIDNTHKTPRETASKILTHIK